MLVVSSFIGSDSLGISLWCDYAAALCCLCSLMFLYS